MNFLSTIKPFTLRGLNRNIICVGSWQSVQVLNLGYKIYNVIHFMVLHNKPGQAQSYVILI